ncbi:MAG: L-aspartate oxidase [Actinomycetota bacterium]
MPGLRAPHLGARALAGLTADLLIVGGGIAGLCAALEAPADARIVVLDKGEAAAGSSPLAQGGMAAAVGPGDSPELHASDTIAAGAGLCEVDVVDDICSQGPDAVAWLEGIGVRFDRGPDGSLDAAREGAQSVARSVHSLDATGAELVRALRHAVAGRPITRIRSRATALLWAEGRVVGAVADGQPYHASATLVATGGAGGLWGATTNAQGATADGAVLGMLVGAQLADLELMQFHPTALAHGGPTTRILLTEALRGDGAKLRNRAGDRFVDELGPRSEVSRAILEEGSVWLDCRDVPALAERYPNVVAEVRSRGFDMLTEPVPVEPAAHYFIGGISADAHGRSSLPGLFAAGEAASTGFHGANRMAGNSLLEAVVVGGRVGRQVVSATSSHAGDGREPAAQMGEPSRAITEILSRSAGIVRNAELIAEGLARLDELVRRHGPDPHAELAGMILRACDARSESRGVHQRSDAPGTDAGMAMRSFDVLGERARERLAART